MCPPPPCPDPQIQRKVACGPPPTKMYQFWEDRYEALSWVFLELGSFVPITALGPSSAKTTVVLASRQRPPAPLWRTGSQVSLASSVSAASGCISTALPEPLSGYLPSKATLSLHWLLNCRSVATVTPHACHFPSVKMLQIDTQCTEGWEPWAP